MEHHVGERMDKNSTDNEIATATDNNMDDEGMKNLL